VWKAGGEVCNHSKLLTTLVSVKESKNSGASQLFAGDTRFTAKASYIA